jgi:hypothetical protein
MILKNLPQGWLPGVEAARRIARSKYCDSPIGRLEEEEAWRELCGHAFERQIRAAIFTGNGSTAEADCEQFLGLGGRYIFQVDALSSWLESEQGHVEIENQPDCEFLDNRGHSVCGELLFSESDIATVCGAEVPPRRKTTSKQDKVDALVAFLSKRYPTRPAMFVDELMEAVKNEAPHIGTFKKRTFEEALAITYPQPRSAKFRKGP